MCAAVNAYNCGLISLVGLARVCSAAVQDMVRLRIHYKAGSRSHKFPWKEVIADLNSDVQAANKLLPPELRVRLVPEGRTGTSELQQEAKSSVPSASVVEGATDADQAGGRGSGEDETVTTTSTEAATNNSPEAEKMRQLDTLREFEFEPPSQPLPSSPPLRPRSASWND